jgi:UDP-N-acetyl-D-mannosaminuronate dehydrogenase
MTTDDPLQVLVGRLDTGWVICEQERDPERLVALEEHWIALLHEYDGAIEGRTVQTSTRTAEERRLVENRGRPVDLLPGEVVF